MIAETSQVAALLWALLVGLIIGLIIGRFRYAKAPQAFTPSERLVLLREAVGKKRRTAEAWRESARKEAIMGVTTCGYATWAANEEKEADELEKMAVDLEHEERRRVMP